VPRQTKPASPGGTGDPPVLVGNLPTNSPPTVVYRTMTPLACQSSGPHPSNPVHPVKPQFLFCIVAYQCAFAAAAGLGTAMTLRIKGTANAATKQQMPIKMNASATVCTCASR